jgi:transposase
MCLSRRQLAKLVGVAPLAQDSGERTGKRRIWGGRADVRAVIYMAALVAKTHNPVIRAFHEKLIAAGKAPKVAIVACMRKLLTSLNAMARDGAAWDPAKHARIHQKARLARQLLREAATRPNVHGQVGTDIGSVRPAAVWTPAAASPSA